MISGLLLVVDYKRITHTHTDTTHTHPAWDIVKVKTAYLVQMLFFK